MIACIDLNEHSSEQTLYKQKKLHADKQLISVGYFAPLVPEQLQK